LAGNDTASGTIRFVLDGETIELQNVDPTRTVLQFLREDLRRTGSKEGCAEGDCGACTVVLAELNLDGDGIDVRAINSCIQFLPTLDGKELITVESLSGENEALHPVQQAMLDCHGSQCGFCTPGFVMSLFALYKTQSSPNRRDIDDALAGNLCRCTGYRPIIAAGETMYEADAGSDWLRQSHGKEQVPRQRVARLRRIQRDSMLAMAHDGRQFYAPCSVEEFAALLRDFPDATILAGGTDVGLWVTKQHRDLDTVIYVGKLAELRELGVRDGMLHIGAAVTLSESMVPLIDCFPRLEELFLRFASPPIRNAGTLGGNLANGSPIGDSMPALMAADTRLLLRSANGTREVALDDFYHDYMVNDLQPGEFLEALRVPLPADGVELFSYKISKRFDQDISAMCAAFQLRIDDGKVASIRIAFGGMAATIRRAIHCEQALNGAVWCESAIESAQAALAKDFQPISDMRATADYRRRVAANLLRRLYLESRGEHTESVYDYGRTG
jgi:xanthine dehydrogenase small subunit